MARITFSIDDELAAKAETKATADRRSLSGYISMLVERDLRGAEAEEAAITKAKLVIALLKDRAVTEFDRMIEEQAGAVAEGRAS